MKTPITACCPRDSTAAYQKGVVRKAAGATEEEARANIREAIELYLEPGDIELPQNARLVEVTVG